MKILLIEDDQQIAKLITSALAAQHYTIDVATDGLEGWEYVNSSPYDLVLLDVMLPRLDGISFCRRLRLQKLQTPVILLTARNTSSDKVAGLEAGADDYLVKPFDVQELLARIRALLRRESYEHESVLEWGALRLNPATLQVTYEAQPLRLRKKEFAILELLLRNKQRVFSRSAILEQLWSLQEAPSEETIKAHIKAICHQLRKVGAEDLIETLYGQGYRLNPLYLSLQPSRSALPTTQDAQVQSTRSALTEIWQQTRSTSFDRIAVLEEAAQSLAIDQLTDELRQKAESNAHKLLGVLGTFGFVEAAQIARQLEGMLGAESVLEQNVQHIQQLVTALRQCLERENQIRTTDPASIVSAPLALSSARSEPQILILDSDRTLSEALTAEAAARKIRTLIASDLATARNQIRQHHPDAILLDLSLARGEDGLTLLQELSAYRSQIPILVLTERDRFIDRLAVVRLGGRAFLPKPVRAAEVLQVVSQMLQQAWSKARILAIDDDAQVLLILQTLLQPAGFHLIPVTEPSQFWTTLQTTAPDLVILDVEMPEVNGIELCQIIRSDPRWNWLPVLFLTAHTNAEIRCRVFAAGADDYMTKPIATTELVQRILNRLNRAQSPDKGMRNEG